MFYGDDNMFNTPTSMSLDDEGDFGMTPSNLNLMNNNNGHHPNPPPMNNPNNHQHPNNHQDPHSNSYTQSGNYQSSQEPMPQPHHHHPSEPQYETPRLIRYQFIKTDHFGNKMKEIFEITAPRYTVQHLVGNGTFALVAVAYDHKLKKHVAIKKICNVFEQDSSQQKRVFRELLILKHLAKFPHPNVTHLIDIIPPRNYKEFNHIYLVMDFMPRDFRQVTNSKSEVNLDTARHFIFQMLKGLKYIHSAGIAHRDLKPSNVLIDNNLEVKLCDFGLSRGINFQEIMSTAYVATRQYRAPELLLCWEGATKSLDMWSLGCIFAELLMPPSSRHILFNGRTYFEQLEAILNVTGSPHEQDIRGCKDGILHMRTLPKFQGKPLNEALNIPPNWLHNYGQALDLLNGMLQFDPIKRIQVDQALRHPFIQSGGDYYNNYIQEQHNIQKITPQNYLHYDICPEEFTYRAPPVNTPIDYKQCCFNLIIKHNKDINGLAGTPILSSEVCTITSS
mmetsp:Transcript_3739/g.5527  ORF Transcript_3739/g.5527 Transcript_3739/m.5527 type:complete len:505 (+) Transcript_3739:55-1569(+)